MNDLKISKGGEMNDLKVSKGELKKTIEMKNNMVKILSEHEYLANIAKVYRKLVEELIKEGFSKEEAIQIAANFNIPRYKWSKFFI